MYKFFLAVKYLLKRPINLLGMIGILLGVWSLIVAPSIFSGYTRELRAHIKEASSVLTIISGSRKVSFRKLEKILEQEPSFVAAAPRVVWYGAMSADRPLTSEGNERRIIKSPADAALDSPKSYQVLGIDFEKECRLTGLRSWLDACKSSDLRVADRKTNPLALPQSGKESMEDPLPRILIGELPAKEDRLHRGDRILMTSGTQSPSRGFEAIQQKFTLAAAFSPKYFKYEKGTAFVDIDVMRKLLDPPHAAKLDSFSEVSVALKDGADEDVVAGRIKKLLREAGDRRIRELAVVTWEQKNEQFLQSIDHQRGLIRVILFVLILIAVILVFVTLLMMVTEKTRDIGILSALGATRRGILAIFVTCGFSISVAGVLLGLLAGWISCIYLDSFNRFLANTVGVQLFPKEIYGLKHVPYEIEPIWMGLVGTVAIAVTLLFSLIPAFFAARRDPVKALRND